MVVAITGGSGMVGQRVARALSARNVRMTLADLQPPPTPLPNTTVVTGSLLDTVDQVITPETTTILHLAAVVSAAAEADFDLGWCVNVAGLRTLLERCRSLGTRPRFIFASTSAAMGPCDRVDDDTPTRPGNSYGHQKAVGEYLVNDYSRKGFVDGLSLRLPTVVVRPGAPNKAATGFFSGILREPLAGLPSTCPVSPETECWISSPASVTASLLHALELPAGTVGAAGWRSINLPGVCVSVAEQIAALEAAGGDSKLVSFERDPAIEAIVATIPARFSTPMALSLGFPPADSLEETIASHLKEHRA